MPEARLRAATGGQLRLERLTKRFGSFTAVQELSLTVPQGSFFALLGPSGCGKTTTLRMIAGLQDPTAGVIRLGDSDLTHAPPHQRPVNTVFQSYALFPHLDVFDNVAFGLRRRGARDVRRRVEEALALVELGPLGRRRPAQLSGGQQQRVALARAVVNRPQLLLLDEPLGALDLTLRRQMQLELKRIQTEVGITFVHVTHDQEEALTMADTVAVMNLGRIEQLGDPVQLYDFPRTAFVANFLGQSNLVAGRRSGSGQWLPVELHGQTVRVPADRCRTSEPDVLVGVRPEKLHLGPVPPDGSPGPDRGNPATNVLTGGIVGDVSFSGVSTQYTVRMPWGQQLTVFAQNRGAGGLTPAGTPVTLSWASEHTFALPAPAAGG